MTRDGDDRTDDPDAADRPAVDGLADSVVRLGRCCRSPFVALRRHAAHSVELRSHPDAAPLILGLLEDPDAEVVLGALEAARPMVGPAMQPWILALTGHRDPLVRSEAQHLLRLVSSDGVGAACPPIPVRAPVPDPADPSGATAPARAAFLPAVVPDRDPLWAPAPWGERVWDSQDDQRTRAFRAFLAGGVASAALAGVVAALALVVLNRGAVAARAPASRPAPAAATARAATPPRADSSHIAVADPQRPPRSAPSPEVVRAGRDAAVPAVAAASGRGSAGVSHRDTEDRAPRARAGEPATGHAAPRPTPRASTPEPVVAPVATAPGPMDPDSGPVVPSRSPSVIPAATAGPAEPGPIRPSGRISRSAAEGRSSRRAERAGPPPASVDADAPPWLADPGPAQLAQTYLGLARRYLHMDNLEQARRYADRALRLSPGSAEALEIRRRTTAGDDER
jgi:hypothetical protein